MDELATSRKLKHVLLMVLLMAFAFWRGDSLEGTITLESLR